MEATTTDTPTAIHRASKACGVMRLPA
jgi:hypothetical protein